MSPRSARPGTRSVRRLGPVAGAALLALLGVIPASGQDSGDGFHAPGPRSAHPHSDLTRGLAETLARAYGGAIYAPGRVEISSAGCPEATVRTEGAEDAATSARVLMCAGLVDAVRAELDSVDVPAPARDTILAAALGLAYAHGVGHALSEMPASGRSVGGEPYATEFTALTYLSRPRLAHWAAVYWARDSARLSGTARRLAVALPRTPPEYGREHGFVTRRMVDLLCWTYGSDPDGRAWMLEETLLTREESGDCRREYRRLTERWGALLHDPIVLGETPETAVPDTAGEAGAGRGDRTGADDPGEAAPWGEAEALWSSYRARVGDVVAPLLADIIRARADLPGTVVVTFEPSPGTLDLEIYAGARSPEDARRVIRDYWRFVREEFGPYLKRRFGPELRERDVRILYYDISGGEPRTVAGLLQGRWMER